MFVLSCATTLSLGSHSVCKKNSTPAALNPGLSQRSPGNFLNDCLIEQPRRNLVECDVAHCFAMPWPPAPQYYKTYLLWLGCQIRFFSFLFSMPCGRIVSPCTVMWLSFTVNFMGNVGICVQNRVQRSTSDHRLAHPRPTSSLQCLHPLTQPKYMGCNFTADRSKLLVVEELGRTCVFRFPGLGIIPPEA
ncbi:hypothetical protein HD554DRAFT_1229152 [Boletus coccyginus]|nr:hypothetical protein HD554DRAFT_1229152 [Boletus coccyginus]